MTGTAPRPPSSPSAFADMLAAACRKKVADRAFQIGYAHVLDLVAAAGTYSVHGLTLTAPAGVYSPHETSSTRFVMDHFFALGLDRPGGRLLEVGSGAGAISLLAARLGWDVTATDIDPSAVAATRHNAALNGLTVKTFQSDLFSQLAAEETFDVILFNQPFYHPQRDVELRERTLTDGGGKLHERFMAGAGAHLAGGGRLILTFANYSNSEILHQPGWRLDLRAFDYEAGADCIRALFAAHRQD